MKGVSRDQRTRVVCERCKKTARFDKKYGGYIGECGHCRHRFVLPFQSDDRVLKWAKTARWPRVIRFMKERRWLHHSENVREELKQILVDQRNEIRNRELIERYRRVRARAQKIYRQEEQERRRIEQQQIREQRQSRMEKEQRRREEVLKGQRLIDWAQTAPWEAPNRTATRRIRRIRLPAMRWLYSTRSWRKEKGRRVAQWTSTTLEATTRWQLFADTICPRPRAKNRRRHSAQ